MHFEPCWAFHCVPSQRCLKSPFRSRSRKGAGSGSMQEQQALACQEQPFREAKDRLYGNVGLVVFRDGVV
jgi:hypothetical protein